VGKDTALASGAVREVESPGWRGLGLGSVWDCTGFHDFIFLGGDDATVCERRRERGTGSERRFTRISIIITTRLRRPVGGT